VPRKPFEIFAELPGVIIQPKKKSGLFLRGFAVKTVLLNCDLRNASTRIYIIAGRRSLWRRARNVWPGIPLGKSHPMKSKIYVRKPWG